jgi:selenocysteine lyase/cysteine desulfurase
MKNKLSRRKWLKRVGASSVAAAVSGHFSTKSYASRQDIELPAKSIFNVQGTFINAAFTHPMSLPTAEAARAYTNRRIVNDKAADDLMNVNRKEAAQLFASLINASPDEIAWVASTMVGENFIVAGLGLPGTNHHVVTDACHFNGSLYLYGQLARQGLDVNIVRPKENSIPIDELDKAITTNTKLVAISLVSSHSGFLHNLKQVCDRAHAKGALVYADIIQAAGAVPIDVKESGVDFCACSGYKWLMADFGAGFLYVRKDRLPLLHRTQYGYRQIDHLYTHVFPLDTPGKLIFDWTSHDDVAGYFQVGTISNGTIAALRESLRYLNQVGVKRIQLFRQPLVNRIQEQLPRFGFIPMTPLGSESPIVSFAYPNAMSLQPKIDKAGINIQLYDHHIRISPSIYNDMDDIEKMIEVLSKS